jgi:hypothetical protein
MKSLKETDYFRFFWFVEKYILQNATKSLPSFMGKVAA